MLIQHEIKASLYVSSEVTAEGFNCRLKASAQLSPQTDAVVCQISLAPHEILNRLSSLERLVLLGRLAICQDRLVYYCCVCVGGCVSMCPRRGDLAMGKSKDSHDFTHRHTTFCSVSTFLLSIPSQCD